jgi:hypothetical protein
MKVQIFLKTPLFRGSYGAKRNAELKANVVEVHGKAEEGKGGITLTVSALYDAKGKKVEAPFAKIFLPLAKIDYYVAL